MKISKEELLHIAKLSDLEIKENELKLDLTVTAEEFKTN